MARHTTERETGHSQRNGTSMGCQVPRCDRSSEEAATAGHGGTPGIEYKQPNTTCLGLPARTDCQSGWRDPWWLFMGSGWGGSPLPVPWSVWDLNQGAVIFLGNIDLEDICLVNSRRGPYVKKKHELLPYTCSFLVVASCKCAFRLTKDYQIPWPAPKEPVQRS